MPSTKSSFVSRARERVLFSVCVPVLLCSVPLVAAARDGANNSEQVVSEQVVGRPPALRDPAPLPSGGSGVKGEMVGELTPVGSGDPQPPLFRSDPAPSADEDPGAMTPLPTVSFTGVINSPVTTIPPDTHMAVGTGLGSAGRVVMVTNAAVQIWNKNGTVIAGPLSLDTMFSTNVFDPKILFDEHSGRFFIVTLEGRSSTPNFSRIHIAVSSTSVPGNLTTNWTFMSGSAVTNFGGANTWADYPGIGADGDSLFTTTNHFTFGSSSFRGMKIRVLDKSALLAGVYVFVDIDFDDGVTNVSTTMPVHVYGATTNGGFYLISRISSTTYRLFHVTGDPLAPIATTSTFAWSGGTFPGDRSADQCNAANPDIATLASRVMTAVYRGGHIWTCLTADPDNDGHTEVVWQDIMPNAWPGGVPSVFQSGFINGTGTNPWTFMPSININIAGDVAINYSQSSTTECPAMYYVTRLGGAPLGTFEAPVLAKSSPGFYNSFLDDASTDRWGDYSATVVDPTDDCFWVANEFVFSSGVDSSEWGTFIAGFCTTEPPPVCEQDDCDDATIPNLNDPLDPGDCDAGLLGGPCSRSFGNQSCDPTIIGTTCSVGPGDPPSPGHQFGSDTWMRYTMQTGETGLLTISTCPADGGSFSQDGMLAVYVRPQGVGCPVDIPNPTECGDDTCAIANGPAAVSALVCEGQVVYIRIGGRNGAQGDGVLVLSLQPTPGGCHSPSRPNPDPELGLGVVAGATVQPCDTVADCEPAFGLVPDVDCIPGPDGLFPGTCYTSASRYLSISPNVANVGPTARRITLDTNDNDSFDPGVDHVLGWVGEPFATVVTGPEPSPQALARVSPDSVYRDWNDLTDVDAGLIGTVPVHLGDCEIAPGGALPATTGNTYFIQAINLGFPEAEESSYSSPLRLRTVTRHADVGGTGNDTNYPNQITSLFDAFKIVVGFQGNQTIPKWRLEQTGGQAADNVPNINNVSLLDVFQAVVSFQNGGAYGFEQPCDCPGQSCP